MGMREDSDTTGEFLAKFRGNFFHLTSLALTSLAFLLCTILAGARILGGGYCNELHFT